MTRAVTCVFLTVVAAGGCGWFDEPLYYASRRVEERWRVGERPKVVVRLTSATNIGVIRGERGEIEARLRLAIVSKISQAVADERVRASPGASFEREGDVVRIVELPGNLVATALYLVVPPDSDLDIETDHAEFCVGCDPTGRPGAALPIARLKARTDRILGARIESASFGPPILDLEAGSLKLGIDGSPVGPTEEIRDEGFGWGVRYRYKSDPSPPSDGGAG